MFCKILHKHLEVIPEVKLGKMVVTPTFETFLVFTKKQFYINISFESRNKSKLLMGLWNLLYEWSVCSIFVLCEKVA